MRNHDESPEDIDTAVVSSGRGWSPGDSVDVTVDELSDISGDTGFGGESMPRLHAWTDERVYFKVVYDGNESVSSVPRNPNTEVPGRYGGG
jgi:hypothetical protein